MIWMSLFAVIQAPKPRLIGPRQQPDVGALVIDSNADAAQAVSRSPCQLTLTYSSITKESPLREMQHHHNPPEPLIQRYPHTAISILTSCGDERIHHSLMIYPDPFR